jgi:hypothetical protein
LAYLFENLERLPSDTSLLHKLEEISGTLREKRVSFRILSEILVKIRVLLENNTLQTNLGRLML